MSVEKRGICLPEGTDASPSLADYAQNVLKTYFQTYDNIFLTKHHIDSYESFIFREMSEIIFSENPITVLEEPLNADKGIYKYKTEVYVGGKDATKPEELKIKVGAPILTLDGGQTVRRMFPNEARIRNMTYAATYTANVDIVVTFSALDPSKPDGVQTITKTITFENLQLFRIPILLRSKLCATYGASRALLYEMGECRNDQGGYFIIDGSEKVLITRQEKAVNTVIVRLKPENDQKLYCDLNVVCQDPKTKYTRSVNINRYKSSLEGDTRVEDGAYRVGVPGIKGGVPLFILFRALGVESDHDIVRMILPDTSAPNIKMMEAMLVPSIHDAWPCLTTEQAIEYMRLLSKGFMVEHILKILHDELFTHVPDEPLARAQYLAEIIRKMMRVELRMEPAPNRDDIRNQRLLPTGTLLRVLFTGCWGDWKSNLIMTVDKQYNYNKTLYTDENFLNIFNEGNISNVLSTKMLNDALMRGFRGKWGTDEWNMKSGVIQPLARISFMDAMSHTRRVVSDFDTGSKLTGPRHLHPSQVGYFCTAETPTGGHIGATKNLSILTAISVYFPIDALKNWLIEKGGVQAVAATPRHEIARGATSVQVNGGTIGFTNEPGQITYVLKLMKWTACIPPTTSISFNTAENIIRIYMDDGRPLRPLYHLDFNKETQKMQWPRRFKELLPQGWTRMVCGDFPPTSNVGVMSANVIDPLESNPTATLQDYVQLLAPHVGCVEYVDPYESNEAYVSWWGNTADLAEHTHAEIHPCTLMGLLANMVPFSNHNQSPRNQLSCSQSKQGIGYYATNFENRFDTYGSMLCYGEGALCRTMIYDAVGNGEMPYGSNIVFCLNSFSGYNQDDGIIFNRSSIERGLFRSLAFRSYECVEEIDPISKVEYRIGNPKNILSWTDLKPGHDFTQLDETGIIREGSIITDKTVLVGRYLLNPETGTLGDASVLPTVFTTGRVDKVVVLHQANGMRLVRIRIFEERVPELGDKFSSRHGQKGTIGMLMDAVDMPRLPSGIVPDVMVNPHCIPSRMTVAQMLEQVFGRLGAEIGAKINATTFMNDNQSLKAMGDALEILGLHRTGEEIVYSGITGKMYTTSVFMGPLHFMRIKHLVSDKLNARGAGRREQRTHQPTGGRGNEGGMRMGEMERDVLIAHGVAKMLEESYTVRSDGTDFWICNGCGTIPIYNESQRMFVCPACDGPLTYQGNTADTIGLVLPVRKSRVTFSRVHMPYALKLMDQELTTYMNGGFRFITEKHARRFREPADLQLAELKESQESLLGVQIGELQQQFDEIERATAPAVPQIIRAEDDAGHPDSPADSVDIGQPESNNEAGANAVPPGGQAIEFNGKSTKYKEFGTYHPVKLVIDDKIWPSAEHYFQAMKYTNNPAYQEEIRKAKTPAAAKKLGKSAEKTMREDWNTYRETVMMNVNRVKFGDAHPDLKQLLISTGDALLLNASPQDNFWGIGRKREGRNKLGKILMEIRAELAPKAPSMEANERIIATNIPPPPEPAAQVTAAAAAPPPVVNIQVVNQQPVTAEQNASNVIAAPMLENQNLPPPPPSAAPAPVNGGPVLVIEEGEGQPLTAIAPPEQQVPPGPPAPGPDTSNVKVVTVNATGAV